MLIWVPSVVVVIVHQDRIRTVKSKRHAPVAIYPDGPVAGQFALEWVKPPAGQAHILRSSRCIQLRQLPPQPGNMGGLNARLTATAEERFEALVSE